MTLRSVAPALFLLTSVGCTDDTAGLDGGPSVDAGPAALEFCSGSYWDLDEQGELISVEVPCARGSICADGAAAGFCRQGDDHKYTANGAVVIAEAIRVRRESLDDYPWCNSAEPTPGGDRCVFQAGCDEPVGLWCASNTCGGNAFLVVYTCEMEPSCQLEYCGCDGQTYEGLPFRPYAHPGPCQ